MAHSARIGKGTGELLSFFAEILSAPACRLDKSHETFALFR